MVCFFFFFTETRSIHLLWKRSLVIELGIYIVVDHAFYSDITKNGFFDGARLIVNKGRTVTCPISFFIFFFVTFNSFPFSFEGKIEFADRTRLSISYLQFVHEQNVVTGFEYFSFAERKVKFSNEMRGRIDQSGRYRGTRQGRINTFQGIEVILGIFMYT